jgi:DNA-directed RNA polymerase specialized sigma24 family protein
MLVSRGSDAETRRTVWAQVITENYQPTLDFAHWRVGNVDDAYMVLQDSAVRILRLLPDPVRIEDRRNYWLKTVQHQCYELLRQRNIDTARTVSRDTPSNNADGEEVLPSDPADPNRDPEMNAIINEENEVLLSALEMHCAGLTERERALLALRLAGYTNAEIASMWGEDVIVIRADMNALMAKLRYRIMHGTK